MKKILFLCLLTSLLCFCFLLAGCATQVDEPSVDVPKDSESDTAETESETETEKEPEPVSVIGNVQNSSKVLEDVPNRTVKILQKSAKTEVPSFDFFYRDAPLSHVAWAVTGTIRTETNQNNSGHVLFLCESDENNVATIFINRRVSGNNGIYRNIIVDGVKTPTNNNELVSATLKDTTDWTAEFAFIYEEGTVSLYLKEPEGEFELMTYYNTEWNECTAKFAVNQYADVTLSDVTLTADQTKVHALRNRLDGVPENPIDTKKVLFIGNSATSRNNVPETLSRLARKAGYDLTTSAVLKSGGTLAQHADTSTDHGKTVMNEITNGGYDIVFLQEVSSCISTNADRTSTATASKLLNEAIRGAGSQTYFYIRPPIGYALAGYDPYTQCLEYDELFEGIAQEIGATNAYVNRAFAYAMRNTTVPLWGSDNAHTSPEGAYLVVCVLFSTIFHTSAEVLDHNGLSAEVATTLQAIADMVVLDQYVPQ